MFGEKRGLVTDMYKCIVERKKTVISSPKGRFGKANHYSADEQDKGDEFYRHLGYVPRLW